MGFENLGFYIMAFLTGSIATCIGLIFALIGWIRAVSSMNIRRRARGSLSLWIFSIAVTIFPAFVGLMEALPDSMKRDYISGREIGIVYLSASIITSVSLLIISLICSCWERSAARSSLMIGSIAMLVVYLLGATLYVFAPAWAGGPGPHLVK